MLRWMGYIARAGGVAITKRTKVADKEGFLEADGAKIHYVVYGTGEPVVLIHGYGVSAEINWQLPGILPLLAKSHQVIALDVRGHGDSDKPHDPAQYGVKMADDVVGLLDHLQIRTAHMIGYSMGGFILLKLMVGRPERFRSAILGGSGGIRPDFPMWAWTEQLAGLLHQGLSYPEANIVAAEAGLDRPMSRLEQTFVRALPDYTDPKAMAAVIESWRKLEVTDEQLRAVTFPTLVVFGSREFPGTLDYIKRLGTLLPAAEVHEIAGTNHFDTVMCREFRQTIKAFLDEQPRTDKGS